MKDNNGNTITASQKYEMYVNKWATSKGLDPEEVKNLYIVKEYKKWIERELE